jgi:hypothetical protein
MPWDAHAAISRLICRQSGTLKTLMARCHAARVLRHGSHCRLARRFHGDLVSLKWKVLLTCDDPDC